MKSVTNEAIRGALPPGRCELCAFPGVIFSVSSVQQETEFE